ncbi:hypothetical protein SB6423_00572 [Klebsiella pasteurii]|uniref:DNA breaking-rejoining protein n=1 Tax=Klebsiella pasteurii TaxID=2587529 RepID=UPI00115A0A36|nr:DNA breaking-rejoining protein [Klebsiella pasteurii]VUS29700.1 hypothetical protein SB6423_00572 [Klebsiella pasteurii]HBM2922459.1 DNA breaking-rejoining protein [Klebsiella oxytoca]HCD9002960.1 DNA breaking-rejoining protein [Klebsiella oxytoca]
MSNPFDLMAARMDAVTVNRMARPIKINGLPFDAIPAVSLEEMGSLAGMGTTLVVFSGEYRPRSGDTVFYDGQEWTVTRFETFNGKPKITLEQE